MFYAPTITSEYQTVDESDSNDAWVEAIANVYEKFNIGCPLHVWENGFVQGYASDAEIKSLVEQTGSKDADDLFEKLNAALESAYRAELEKVERELNEDE